MIFKKEHELVRKLAKSFAEKEIAPIAEEVDKTAEFPMELYKKMGEVGFLGVKTPVKYGGSGGDHISYVIVMEEIAKASGVASIYISGNNSLYAAPLLKFQRRNCFGFWSNGTGGGIRCCFHFNNCS